jgi:hypothetical protein
MSANKFMENKGSIFYMDVAIFSLSTFISTTVLESHKKVETKAVKSRSAVWTVVSEPSRIMRKKKRLNLSARLQEMKLTFILTLL